MIIKLALLCFHLASTEIYSLLRGILTIILTNDELSFYFIEVVHRNFKIQLVMKLESGKVIAERFHTGAGPLRMRPATNSLQLHASEIDNDHVQMS